MDTPGVGHKKVSGTKWSINLEKGWKVKKEYRENDVIRKYQIDYNQSIAYTPRFPQAFHREQEMEKVLQICI